MVLARAGKDAIARAAIRRGQPDDGFSICYLDAGQGGRAFEVYFKAMQKSKSVGKPLVLDARPIFARGGSPCGAIDEAVASLAPNQQFVLLVPFEPAPLFAKLAARGLSHRSEQMPDGTYRIEFTQDGTPEPDAAGAAGGSCCGGH